VALALIEPKISKKPLALKKPGDILRAPFHPKG
jgi:hypothetical protein